MDKQKVDFERGLPSYLFGKWQDHGWWYYYLVCAVLKIPLGTWALAFLAVGVSIKGLLGANLVQSNTASQRRSSGGCTSAYIDEFTLLLPALALLAFVSSQIGFSRHFRYVLPTFPFFFIWISKIASAAKARHWTSKPTMAVALIWSVTSSLWIYPHSMSYFNELAGGPRGGHRYLLHSNLDWGQDVAYLRSWWLQHQNVESLYSLSRNSYADDLLVAGDENGLGAKLRTLICSSPGMNAKTGVYVPKPGWYSVSVHRIYEPDCHFASLQLFEPMAQVGYSTWIYNITLEQSNRVRQLLGLPEICNMDEGATKTEMISRFAASASSNKERSPDISVAIYTMDGDGENETKNIQRILDEMPVGTWSLISPADIQSGIDERHDLVIIPGGSGSEMAEALNETGKQALRDYVKRGGGYVGICGGAYLATSEYSWSLRLVNARTLTGMRSIPGQGMISMSARGVGKVKIELTDEGRRILGDFPGLLDVQYSGGPVLLPARSADLPSYVPLAFYRTELWDYEPQKGTMLDTPAILATHYGKGRVVVISPHPEDSNGLEFIVERAVLSVARGLAK